MDTQSDRERFAEAGANLLASLPPEVADIVVRDFDRYSEATRQGQECDMGPLAAAAVRAISQHILQGYPLALPAPVVEFYLAVAAGELGLETPLFECENCGYGLPRVFTVCPLCGGRVALGAHSQKCAAKAVTN